MRLQNHKNGEAGPGALTSAPDVVGLVINAGDQMLAGQQRSMVNSVLVVFDRAVTLDAAAFTIKLHGDVTVDDEPGQEVGSLPTLSWATTDGGISWLVTFSGDGVSAGSIAGGVYELKTVHDKVHAGSATMAADRVDTLHRMFGDINGDGIVDSVDVDAFAAAYDASTGDPNYVRGFDIDLSDSIDDDDAAEIKEKTWTWVTGTSQVVAFTVNRFDQAGRTIQQITGDAHENELADYTYTYDIVNRLTQQTHNGVASTFTYDNAGQVTAETNSSGTSSFTFDANGNRTMTGYTTGDGPGGSPDDNRLTSDGTWNYTYDLEGNMVRRESIATTADWLYQYDHNNQLIQVDRKTDGTNIDLTVIYTYDAWGNRIAQSIDTANLFKEGAKAWANGGWDFAGFVVGNAVNMAMFGIPAMGEAAFNGDWDNFWRGVGGLGWVGIGLAARGGAPAGAVARPANAARMLPGIPGPRGQIAGPVRGVPPGGMGQPPPPLRPLPQAPGQGIPGRNPPAGGAPPRPRPGAPEPVAAGNRPGKNQPPRPGAGGAPVPPVGGIPPGRPPVPPIPPVPPARPGGPPPNAAPLRGRAPEFPGGRVTESGFLRSIERFLGPGYRSLRNGRYVSEDGLRQVRFGPDEVQGPGLHGHFEAYDVPGGRVIENTRVIILPD